MHIHQLITDTLAFLVLHPVRVFHILKRLHPTVNHGLRNFHRIHLTHLDLQLHQHGSDRVSHAPQVCTLASCTVEHLGEVFRGVVDKTLEFFFQELLKLRQHQLPIGFIILRVADHCNGEPGEIVEGEWVWLLLRGQSLLLSLLGLVVFRSPIVDSGEVIYGMRGHGNFRGGERVASGLGFGLKSMMLQVRLEVAELGLQTEKAGDVAKLALVLCVVGNVLFFHEGLEGSRIRQH